MKLPFAALACLLAFGGTLAEAAEIGPVSAPLKPMTKPEAKVGATETWQDRKGRQGTYTLVAADGTTATWESDRGCIASYRREGFFPYPINQANCGKRNAYNNIRQSSGDIWPLKVGKAVGYLYSGGYVGGRSWEDDATCEVVGEVRVRVPAGEFDTYRIVCKATSVTSEHFISPRIGTEVMSKWTDNRGRWPARINKLVSFGPGTSG